MRRCLFSLAVLVLGTTSAPAQVITLTETDAVKLLSSESPRVRALRAEIDIAQANVAAARRFPNPSLTFSREAVAGVTEYYPLFTQLLPVTGRRGLEAEAAQARLRATELRTTDLERRARAEVRLAFAALLEQQAREDHLKMALEHLRDLARALASREAAGDAAGFDRVRAEREVAEWEADLGLAGAARVRAQAGLAGFFSPAPDPARIRAAAASAAAADPPAVETLVAGAESLRADLVALGYDAEAARFARRAAERRPVPEPEVTAGMKASNGERGGVIGVSLSLPLFDRAQPEWARAEALERQALAQAEALRAGISADVAALREVVLVRRAALQAYTQAAAGRAGELERIAQVSYEAGERGILELLDAYRSSATARLRATELEAALRRAEIELEFVSGWETLR
jgi:cobalt-zinc-cadmium efflux system outer membrane protein